MRHLQLLFVALATTGIAPHAAAQSSGPTVGYAAGESGAVRGLIVGRRADDLVVCDQTTGAQSTVTLTADTKITSPAGLLNIDVTRPNVTALIPGLLIAVRGSGGSRGNLVADQISFHRRAFRVATQTADGEVDLTAPNARTSEPIEYEVKHSTTLSFGAGSAELTAESKRKLDAVIRAAAGVSGYLVEVAGFADATELPHNQRLSTARADVVVAYLTQTHSMPLRRIVNHTTTEGRALNRRVEVKLVLNRPANPRG